jgi:hypothetical protein
MRIRFVMPVIFLVVAMLAGCASVPPPAATSPTKMPKDVFLTYMEKQSPQILCTESKYRTCLSVSQQRCESEVSVVAPKCTEQMMKTMPEYVASKEDGRRYGEEYGKCLVMRQIMNGKYDIKEIQKCK